MSSFVRHVSRTLVAGVVALLPIGGTVLLIVFFEGQIAASWKSVEPLAPYYFPGLGLVAAVLAVYIVGLVVSTWLGRWLWRLVDKMLDRLPMLGGLYRSLKQILGYGEGKGALFERVVYVKSREHDAEEIALVTRETNDADGNPRLVLFVPGSPNPATGRLLLAAPQLTRDAGIPVHEALKRLVAIGKLDDDESEASSVDRDSE